MADEPIETDSDWQHKMIAFLEAGERQGLMPARLVEHGGSNNYAAARVASQQFGAAPQSPSTESGE